MKPYLSGDHNMEGTGGAVPITNPTVIQQSAGAAVPTTIQYTTVAAPTQHTHPLLSYLLPQQQQLVSAPPSPPPPTGDAATTAAAATSEVCDKLVMYVLLHGVYHQNFT